MYALYVCRISIPSMYGGRAKGDPCRQRLPYMYALYVCLICMLGARTHSDARTPKLTLRCKFATKLV